MSSTTISHLDLADLPVIKKDNLCKILDQNDTWEELGQLMQFNLFDIEVNYFRKFRDDSKTSNQFLYFRI